MFTQKIITRLKCQQFSHNFFKYNVIIIIIIRRRKLKQTYDIIFNYPTPASLYLTYVVRTTITISLSLSMYHIVRMWVSNVIVVIQSKIDTQTLEHTFQQFLCLTLVISIIIVTFFFYFYYQPDQRVSSSSLNYHIHIGKKKKIHYL